MVAEATINQFRAGNPLDIIENTAELPNQSVQSFSSTKIVWGKKSGSFWAQDRIEIEGQNLSYNPLTGVASGTVTSIKIIPAISLIINGVVQPNPLEIIGLSQPVGPIVQAVVDGNYAALTAILDAQPFVYNGSSGNDDVTFGAGYDKLHMGTGDDVAHSGGGNDLLEGWSGNDVLYGDAGDDLFYGNTGNDKLFGGIGNDTIYAAEDDDYLNGGAGSDTMYGGTGNDTFIVAAAGDQTIELAGQGTDTVQSYINWTLSDNVERLELLGTASLNGTGNALNNTLVGNAASNIFNGAAGDDYMVGGSGNDTYLVASAGDRTIEAASGGTDTVRSYLNWALAANVERLELLGTANLNGTGNALANTLVGNSGNNVLNGGAGNDYMAGGAGNDTFFFNTALGASNIDTITDYNVAQDTVRLENGIFTALVGTGTLTAAQFVKNASGTATDANDRIIYETDTGKLFYDSNGSAAGGQVQFAKLAAGLALTASDFFIV